MAHTILLVQPGVKLDTRTYTDYESVNECMEVIVMYHTVVVFSSVRDTADLNLEI
jgi:hypothetical protein